MLGPEWHCLVIQNNIQEFLVLGNDHQIVGQVGCLLSTECLEVRIFLFGDVLFEGASENSHGKDRVAARYDGYLDDQFIFELKNEVIQKISQELLPSDELI